MIKKLKRNFELNTYSLNSSLFTLFKEIYIIAMDKKQKLIFNVSVPIQKARDSLKTKIKKNF